MLGHGNEGKVKRHSKMVCMSLLVSLILTLGAVQDCEGSTNVIQPARGTFFSFPFLCGGFPQIY